MAEIIGIGSHIVECLRIARMINRYGELFIQRVYTAEETRYCQSRKQATPHFAALWAAKALFVAMVLAMVYEIAARKEALPAELQAALLQEPIVLPIWDPMGALAR